MLGRLKYLFIPVMFLAYGADSNGQTSSYGELQTAYIFNFAKYIKWPAEAGAFVIGVAGETDILDELQNTLREKKIGGRPIEIRTITDPAEATACNIIYLPESGSREIATLKAAIAGKKILLVTEEDLIKRGACISFVVEDDRLRFKLRKAELEKAGLEASEGLLKLAILL